MTDGPAAPFHVRARRFARREPLVALAFALATLATLIPVFAFRYLPLLDYPNHLSVVFVFRHLDDPAWGFAPFYQRHLVPLPYFAQYAAVYLLSFPFGIELAQKLFLAGALVGLPAALAAWARRLGRDPRLAIFAFPLAWNMNVANGFLNYQAGAAALLYALALLDDHARAPRLGRGVVAALAGALLYFFHVLAWGAFLAIGGACAVAPRGGSRRGLKHVLLALAPLVPPVVVGLLAYRASSTMQVKVAPFTRAGLAGWDVIFHQPEGVLRNLPDWLLNFHPGDSDEAIALGLLLAFLLIATRPPLAVSARDPLDWRQPIAFVVACALLLLLPRTLRRPFYWYAINSRLAVVVAATAILFVRGPVTRGARRPLYAVAAVLAIAFPLDVARAIGRFNREARGFDEVMAAVPRGERVLPLMMTLGDPSVNVNAFNQWGSYVQLRLGGFVPYNNEIDFPIRKRRSLAAPPWDHPEAFSYAREGRDWDAFLLHGKAPADPFAGHHGEVRLTRRAGAWELWEKVRK